MLVQYFFCASLWQVAVTIITKRILENDTLPYYHTIILPSWRLPKIFSFLNTHSWQTAHSNIHTHISLSFMLFLKCIAQEIEVTWICPACTNNNMIDLSLLVVIVGALWEVAITARKNGTCIMNVWHIGYGEHVTGRDNVAWHSGRWNPKAEEMKGRMREDRIVKGERGLLKAFKGDHENGGKEGISFLWTLWHVARTCRW